VSPWRQLARGLRALIDRKAVDQEIADEVDGYREQAIAELVAGGLSPDVARRVVRLEAGSANEVHEQVRSYGWENAAAALFADIRYAARRLRNSPGFTTVSVLTLALGIGASTAIFSAVNPILFEPLPYPHAGRIMMIWDIVKGSRLDVTFHTYRELAARNRSFEALAVMESWHPAMTSAAQPERFDGQSVSWTYFHVLGVSPAIGRDFEEADDHFRGPRVAILSDGLWRRRFGGDSSIVGRQVTLDDNLYIVIGVMPSAFESVLAPSAEIWAPLQYDPRDIANFNTGEWGHHLRMVGRLRPGFNVDQARQDLSLIARTPAPEFPRPGWASLQNGFIVNSLQGEITLGVKPALLAVVGAVVLLLLIACVNVTNLLLARGSQRRGEFAMRAALGAGRSRLIRQLLTESLLLAILAGTLGIAVAQVGVRALVALSPPGLPRVNAIAADGVVLAFALGITTLIGLGAGMIPAVKASRGDLMAGMQPSSRRTAGAHQGTRRLLVVSEVAFAVVLLANAGLLVRSLQRLFGVAPGFDASSLVTMQVQESGHRFDDNTARRQFFAQALDAVRHAPGVASAAFTSLLPLSGDAYGVYGAQFENEQHSDVFRYVVTPGYFETMGIPLRRGRLLDVRDDEAAPPVVLISESLAKSVFPSQDPIGQRVHVGPPNRPWYTIAGIVGDVKQTSLAEAQPKAVYITPPQSWFADAAFSLVVRGRGEEAGLISAAKNAIWSVDKDQPIVRVATMDELLAVSESERRFTMIVFETFALAALVLSAIGIYGVLSGSVTERTREIGVRAALGASRGNILTLVVRQGMTLTALGVLIGLGGAAAATQAIATLLFGVSRLDPIAYLGVIALLATVSGIASWVPAWRAAKVDPAVTLRAD
jgi:putative ABC transport system permease protein